MEFCTKLLLVLFVTFLSTPTVVSLIEKNCDTSIFYTMTEEEETHKELKVVFDDHYHAEISLIADASLGKIHSENLSRHDNVSSSVFSPPPDQI